MGPTVTGRETDVFTTKYGQQRRLSVQFVNKSTKWSIWFTIMTNIILCGPTQNIGGQTWTSKRVWNRWPHTLLICHFPCKYNCTLISTFYWLLLGKEKDRERLAPHSLWRESSCCASYEWYFVSHEPVLVDSRRLRKARTNRHPFHKVRWRSGLWSTRLVTWHWTQRRTLRALSSVFPITFCVFQYPIRMYFISVLCLDDV